MLNKFFDREEGQGLVEYALILVLVAIVVIAILLQLGPQINQAFCQVANALQSGTCGIITTASGSSELVGPGDYKVKVNVTVTESTDVTVELDGQTKSTTCNSNCEINFTGVTSSSGGFTVTATKDGSSYSGTYS